MIDLAFELLIQQGDFVLDIADTSRVEVLGLFGPSGAGKTTLLESIAGLRAPTRGELTVGATTLFSSSQRINLPARDRRIGYVPQDSLLFPHLTVRGNLAYGTPPVAVRRSPVTTDLDSVAAMLEIVPLLDRRIQGLSGGERQRVALGRALMTQPALLLLDEPLAAVDRGRRDRILPYLLRIRREWHIPLIYVTHDAAELSQIADRVLVIGDGRVHRAGAPADVLDT
ncbi:MAG TPA: ATP-binding cassette domain-containing protein [Vicinamibacterales bacterium]|nr:ATP-binding cassette domain-containing protein [Vicinamibacterales bacterium]